MILEVGVLFGISIFWLTSGNTKVSSVTATGGTAIPGILDTEGAEYFTSPSALYRELECEDVLECEV